MRTFNLIIPALALSLCVLASGCGNGKMKGIDPKDFDFSVSPKDDFYQYACGGWMKANPLPAQYSRYGVFDILAENNKTQVKELVQNLGKTSDAKQPGTIAQKVNDMYLLGMDSVRLNSEKAEPLRADLQKIASANRADFIGLISWLHKGMAAPFFDTGVMADLMDSNTNIMYVSLAGLGLGDRDYYLESDENTLKIRNAYEKYVATVMELAGFDKEAAQAAVKYGK